MRNGRFTISVTAAIILTGGLLAGQSKLPYAAVHDPEFISASSVTFLNDDDRVIGLMAGTTAKAYPGGILSQHGLVEDRSPDGPIAVTW